MVEGVGGFIRPPETVSRCLQRSGCLLARVVINTIMRVAQLEKVGPAVGLHRRQTLTAEARLPPSSRDIRYHSRAGPSSRMLGGPSWLLPNSPHARSMSSFSQTGIAVSAAIESSTVPVGKSTMFNALTRNNVLAGNCPVFATIAEAEDRYHHAGQVFARARWLTTPGKRRLLRVSSQTSPVSPGGALRSWQRPGQQVLPTPARRTRSAVVRAFEDDDYHRPRRRQAGGFRRRHRQHHQHRADPPTCVFI